MNLPRTQRETKGISGKIHRVIDLSYPRRKRIVRTIPGSKHLLNAFLISALAPKPSVPVALGFNQIDEVLPNRVYVGGGGSCICRCPEVIIQKGCDS